MKKQNLFTQNWKPLSENNGTINKCLVDFKNTILLANEKYGNNDFVIYCNTLFADKSNKELNSLYYKEIKDAYKIGEEYEIKRKNTIIIAKRKCTEFTIYKYCWSLFKKENSK